MKFADAQLSGVDIHKDTPTEILHTMLLGVVKYYWGQTLWYLDKNKQFSVFQARLNSIVADGLNIPPIPAEYMCQYKGGLIGKHFKTISQIMVFTLYDIVPGREILDAWLIIGRLTVLLWHTDIQDTEEYIVSLSYSYVQYYLLTHQSRQSLRSVSTIFLTLLASVAPAS